MDKIFDKEVEKYLKESGVSEKEIARIKIKAIRGGIKDVLHKASNYLLNNSGNIEDIAFNSPAGDGYGADNYCLEFGRIIGEEYIDIQLIYHVLRNYEKVLKQ